MPKKSTEKTIIELTPEQKKARSMALAEAYQKYSDGEIDDAQLETLERKIKKQFAPKTSSDTLGDYIFNRLNDNDPAVLLEYFQFLIDIAKSELGFVPDTEDIKSNFDGLSFSQLYDELKTIKKKGIAIIPGLNAQRDKITIPYNGLEYSVSEYVAEYLSNVNKEKEVDIKVEKLTQLKKSLDEKIIDGKLFTQLKNQIEAGEDVEIPTVKPQLELPIEEEDEEEI